MHRPFVRPYGGLFPLLALGAFLFPVSEAGAQDTPEEPTDDLVGVVVDAESGRPLVGAFVALVGSGRGSATGAEGRFVLPGDLHAGVDEPLTLEVRMLGYETLEATREASEETSPPTLRLRPDPIVLEGLTVMTDRFRARRRAVATSVRAYDREELSTTAARDVVDFIRGRAGVPLTRQRGQWLVWSRGRLVQPTVWVDEHPFPGGLDFLALHQPHEIYLVEVYGFGRHIRVYTNQYMERVSTGRMFPVLMNVIGS